LEGKRISIPKGKACEKGPSSVGKGREDHGRPVEAINLSEMGKDANRFLKKGSQKRVLS